MISKFLGKLKSILFKSETSTEIPLNFKIHLFFFTLRNNIEYLAMACKLA